MTPAGPGRGRRILFEFDVLSVSFTFAAETVRNGLPLGVGVWRWLFAAGERRVDGDSPLAALGRAGRERQRTCALRG